MLAKLAVNTNATIQEQQISERCSCVIVDNFLQNPDDVIEFAISEVANFSIPERSYPGMVLDIDRDSMSDVYRFIRSRMSRQFNFLRGGINFSAILSMTTLQPEQLSNLQRLCHTDPRSDPDRDNYASVLYLFENDELGGTAFYRWKEKETIREATALDLENPNKALEFLQSRFTTYNKPAEYLTESNEIAEKLVLVPARFNRLIFYSGDVPHSAWIRKPELLCDDPAKGRLSLNCFASVHPG